MSLINNMLYANQPNGNLKFLEFDHRCMFTEHDRRLAYRDLQSEDKTRNSVETLTRLRELGSHQAGFLLGAIECGFVKKAIKTEQGLIMNYDEIVGALWKAEDGGFTEYAEHLRRQAGIAPDANIGD